MIGLEIAKEPLLTLTSAQIYHWWRMALADFSRRQLTYSADTLPAIAGLASVVSRVTNDTYLVGLWQQDLGKGLMWINEAPRGEPQIPDLSAPSWSWARSEMRVCHEIPGLSNNIESFVHFVSADIKAAGANLFGRVLPGCVLTIRAPARPGLIHWEQSDDRITCFIPTTHHGRSISVLLDSDVTYRTNVVGKQMGVLAVKIAAYTSRAAGVYSTRLFRLCGLLLRLTDDGMHYQRIGAIEIYSSSGRYNCSEADIASIEHFYNDAETRTISII